jgi:hypothetical protein
MQGHCPPQFVILMSLGALMVFFGPRNWVLPTFLALTVFVAMSFNVVLLGLNFYSGRIFLLLGWARVFAKGEHRGVKFLPLDKAFLLFACSMVAIETLRRGLPGLVYGAANNFYDGFGTYLLFRVFLRKSEDINRVVVSLACICSGLAAFMLAENLTRHNWLTALGAGLENVQQRAGRMRCQATFLHPVLAGTYGAVLLPLFAACWWQGRRMKKVAIAGCIASTIITVTAGSGGPVMTYVAAVFGLCLWPLRRQMRPMRWGILLTLISLHLVMKAPVWALIGRVQIVQGASAYHRYDLLNTFIQRVGDWWLLGVDSTADWGWLIEDVANTYCIVAKHGGLLALLLFLRLLTAGFREVGLRRSEAEHDRPAEIMVWAFGACLFAHLITFFGTSYFDQTRFLWSFTLALLASLPLLAQNRERPPQSVAEEEVFVRGNQGLSLV